jgi:outer membrane protein assembly factor BamD
VCFLAGCSTTRSSGHPDYTADAKTNLDKGNEALASKSYVEAERYFDYVRTKYPFLDASKEAELKLADTDFAKEQFPEARDRYTNFAKLHPTHPKADYAAYRAALTHYKEMPSTFFILPPPYEKDQTEIRAAAKSLGEFIRDYPNSTYVPEAKKLQVEVQRGLVKHELYVADFYAWRDRWSAVAPRLENVAEKYPGLGYDVDALFRLHDVYLKLKAPEKAKDALRRIVQRYPGSDAASRAQRMLDQGS